MNRQASLWIVGLIVVGGLAAYFFFRPAADPPAKYVLTFDHTNLIDPAGFVTALKNAHPRWQRNLSFDPASVQDGLTANYTDPHLPPVTTSHQISSNPANQHVTQKVGVNRIRDLNAILEAIDGP